MSANGYSQTFQGVSQNVGFTPENRHSHSLCWTSGADP